MRRQRIWIERSCRIDGISALIVHGSKDSIVKPDYARQAQRAYPNAKLHIIEDGAYGFRKKHDAVAHPRKFGKR